MIPLAEPEHRVLLYGAVKAVEARLDGGQPAVPNGPHVNGRLRAPGASFVTLERGGALLGCIGTLEAYRPLVEDVVANAVAAAFADPRLPDVTPEDYQVMSVKVSVLSALEPLPAKSLAALSDAVRPGVDGLVVWAGRRRGTLLPSVWPRVRGVPEFLDHLWLKAGLRPGTWGDDLSVLRYTTEEFADPGPRR